MMRKTADVVTSVTVVVRMATEGRVQAELTTLLNCLNVLIDGVNSLQDAATHLLEFAQLGRLFDAVVFQVVGV